MLAIRKDNVRQKNINSLLSINFGKYVEVDVDVKVEVEVKVDVEVEVSATADRKVE
jgi:hypothetical protein